MVGYHYRYICSTFSNKLQCSWALWAKFDSIIHGIFMGYFCFGPNESQTHLYYSLGSLPRPLLPFCTLNWTGYSRGGHCICACTRIRDRGQDLDPRKFRPWPLDRRQKSTLTAWPTAYNAGKGCSNELWPLDFAVKFYLLTPWLPTKFRLDRLTSFWPRSRMWVQAHMQWPPLVASNKLWVDCYSINFCVHEPPVWQQAAPWSVHLLA